MAFAANSSYRFFNYHMNAFRAFQDAGYEVFLICPSDGWVDRLEAIGCRHVDLPLRAHSKNPFRELVTLWALVRAYRRIRPSIAFHFTIKCNLYGALAARMTGVPFVNNITGLGSAFNSDGPLNRFVGGILRLAQKNSARVFFQNAADLEFMRERKLVAPAQAQVLPGSGVNLDHFLPEPKPRGSTFTFVFAGRMLWEKGLAYLAEAMERVRREEPAVECLAFGFLEPGNPKYVDAATLAGWESRGLLRYCGPLEDVKQAFRLADCVILPTYYREGVPKSLLEAMAMSKPLLATDLPGCRQALRDEDNGLMCAPRDAAGLAETMLRMVRLEPGRLARMGARGREIVEEGFGEARVIARYLETAEEFGRDGDPRGR